MPCGDVVATSDARRELFESLGGIGQNTHAFGQTAPIICVLAQFMHLDYYT